MKHVGAKIRIAFALGLLNIIRVSMYRISKKLGISQVSKTKTIMPTAPYFIKMPMPSVQAPLVTAWGSFGLLFGSQSFPMDANPPNWQANPLTGEMYSDSNKFWEKIPDFNPQVGDIKLIWELSRMDWVLAFAQQVRNGDDLALNKLNLWLTDWCGANPAYFGFNWKCGQEASIRVIHLATAALIMGQIDRALPSLLVLIRIHLQRIAATLSYAIAQDNNHGTSEAAALFIGGSWLSLNGDEEGHKWASIGRKWLENRAEKLIESDGSFSQYSVNYHRLMLDTYSIVEIWHQRLNIPRFSDTLYTKLSDATKWLYCMVQPETGNAPNVGANDGANLLPLSDADYRDFRPSVQLAMALFCQQRAYVGEGEWNASLIWLGVGFPESIANLPKSIHFEKGGYSLLRIDKAFALLRYPNYRFRPSQADALHVDLWIKGQNLLRDAGTYSYNAVNGMTDYFGGTTSHNTIQFDGRDQMPRLSRFLFSHWLKAEDISFSHEQRGAALASASYKDSQGACHFRQLELESNNLQVLDKVSNFKRSAVLRWRLDSSDWVINGLVISNGKQRIIISSTVPIARFEIVQGWESLYYLQKKELPVLEVEINQAGELKTEIQFIA